jgi:hypothetical protein
VIGFLKLVQLVYTLNEKEDAVLRECGGYIVTIDNKHQVFKFVKKIGLFLREAEAFELSFLSFSEIFKHFLSQSSHFLSITLIELPENILATHPFRTHNFSNLDLAFCELLDSEIRALAYLELRVQVEKKII